MPEDFESQPEQSMSQFEVDYLFDAIVAAEYPPEKEIYGRSLSTIRSLGAFMIGKAQGEVIGSPEADQAKVEFFTSVEEGFGTDMELGGGLEVRDFDERPVMDGLVMAKDLKTPVSGMTKAGLGCARETLKEDDRFLPQYIRSVWDHENALIVDSMARGETNYNTRIVISPFPEEAAAQSGNEYWRNIGYVPHLKRGFVQLYHITKDGRLVTGSLSFDGSNKHQLQIIQSGFGVKIPEQESTNNWLKYPLVGTLSEDEAKLLSVELANLASNQNFIKTTNTVDVTRQYRPVMNRVFDESYIHVCESLSRGRQTDGVKILVQQLFNNAHNFNERYSLALLKMRVSDGFNEDDSIVLHELLVYSTIEMMRSLHLKNTVFDHVNAHANFIEANLIAEQLRNIDASSFQKMLGGFGAEGAKNNRKYSACGISISAGGEEGEGGPQGVFGGLDNEKSEKKWMNCPHCDALVYDDPCAKVLKCWDCKAAVIYGKQIKGNGGRKARETRKKAEKLQDQKEQLQLRRQTQELGAKVLQATNEQFAIA